MKTILAKIIIFLHKKFPKTIPVMTCSGCLKQDCINRSYKYNKICIGYKRRKK